MDNGGRISSGEGSSTENNSRRGRDDFLSFYDHSNNYYDDFEDDEKGNEKTSVTEEINARTVAEDTQIGCAGLHLESHQIKFGQCSRNDRFFHDSPDIFDKKKKAGRH